MNKKVSLGVTLALIFLSIAMTVSITVVIAMRHFGTMQTDLQQRVEMFDYINDIDKIARQNYIIDEERLRAALFRGYVEGLGDPYAAYLTASEYQAAQNAAAGKQTGFGLEVTLTKENMVVVSVCDNGSPAALSGVQKGDVVTAADGEEVSVETFEALQHKLRENSKILLSLTRGETDYAVELSSNTYTAVSVESRMAGSVGILRIRTFDSETPSQFKSAYRSLLEQGATSFLFDLRDNEGGSLDAAKDVIAFLMPRGPYAKYTTKSGTETLMAEDSDELQLPSVTLVNGTTAGEAELFAGVLQNFGKTQVIGTATAGKNTVQNLVAIESDKSAVRITVASLSLIQNNVTWQDTGIQPSQVVEMPEALLPYAALLTDEEDPQIAAGLAALQGNSPPSTTAPVESTGTATAPTETSAESSGTESAATESAES